MAKSIMEYRVGFLSRAWRALAGYGSASDPIQSQIVTRAAEARRGEFQAIGIINEIQTAAGLADPQKVISFGTGRGLALGRFPDGSVDLIDAWEWNGLPDRYDDTGAPLCRACQVQCNECWPGDENLFAAGESSVYAMLFKRGDHLKQGERPCVYGSQLTACGGLGLICFEDKPDETCPTCQGSGKVKCRKCQGTGMMSTGRIPLPVEPSGTPTLRICENCQGTGRMRKVISQDLCEHVNQSLSPRSTISLGPIYGLMLTGVDRHTHIWVGKQDEQGNYPHIVSNRAFAAGTRAVIVGGVLRPK